MPNFDPKALTPAERAEPEPRRAQLGWSAKEVGEDELVDDEFIKNDPDSFEVEVKTVGDSGTANVG
jgi:hypothetical protein